jgi:hypothetical protein
VGVPLTDLPQSLLKENLGNMGNKNEGYLGGIMGGESRVGSGTATTGTQKTVQDLTLHNQLSLVGDKVDMGFTDSVSNAYFSLTPGSGYQYLEVRYNTDSSGRKRFVLGLVEAASSTNNTQGQHSYSRGLFVDSSSLVYRAGSSLPSTYGSLDYILAMLLNLDTGDVYMSICDPGNAPVWVREDNTESTTFDVANPTFSGLDLTTLDTVFAQLSLNETYMNFNFGGNPLFDAEETSGNDSSTWYNDPPVSVVSFGQQEVTLKVANTGILSLEEAGTQVVDATLGDDNWNDVTLLLDGSSLTDASTAANNFTAQGDAAANNTVVSDPYGGTKGSFIFDGAGDALTSTNGDIIGISNPFTVEMWVRPDSTSTYQYLDIYGPNTGTGTGWTSGGRLLELNASTTSMQLQWWNGSTSRYNLLMTNTMSVSTWHHVAVVYDGTGMEVYVDGSSIGSMTGATTDGSATNTVFGIYNTGVLPFDGRMHDIRITKGVARYASNFTPPTESFPTSLPVGDLTLPQLSWGGITGRSVLTEGSAAVPGDDNWNDVTLLLDGSSLTDDLSTAGNATTDEGAAIVSVTGPYGGTQDVLDFDRTGSTTTTGKFIKTGVTDDFKFGTSPFTIEMWLKPDTLDTSSQSVSLGCICEYDTTAGISGSWFGLHQVNGEVRFYIDNGNTNLTTTSSGLSTSNWSHVAIVRDAANTLTIYVDGTSKAVSSAGAFSHNLSDASSRQLYIGKQPTQLRHYDGKIADIRITKGVARYASNFTPPTESFPTSLPVAGTPDTLVDTGIFTLEEIYELNKSA